MGFPVAPNPPQNMMTMLRILDILIGVVVSHCLHFTSLMTYVKHVFTCLFAELLLVSCTGVNLLLNENYNHNQSAEFSSGEGREVRLKRNCLS